ncbi:MAG: DNA polymerase III subunit gamma/tau [Ilumatobacteraceae bacterium]|jgi:DNA polymerase III subunit gamma/tau|nr:DNA polymerase III subunit gamma/tau [Ilumatobacteraceae bacterium]MDP4706414.1 DNA polymerase III subunit gamma/tau [Ilumatobacteraceae bacterium]MDP4937616.1 DNA polymerase III subunit gamma/tau [Ilumatobacteraceae bacterium]MDP5115398.1 DNA polymerase III subunit gamma/tau [Ilumatobacteraceae bacterium]
MAVQSLYRRYRPQRFSELKGQEHVVRALKNAVVNSREGHAYLFSGPRGTGKTTTARILAKVLNCENPQDGEPCCECGSCLAVQEGNSFDVIELDAASNNGVEDIREIIAAASLGSPGRHKVYILDEVHMLSKGASAALLKTLEEPPSHVVFVLATTDPEKVAETIRSRTQHLQFHLLPVDELEAHVRWVASDAGIDISDASINAVLRQGGGSARDTLSALELAAATGGMVDEVTPVDEFVEAFIEYDAGRLLAAVAHTVNFGRDPRTIVNDLVRHMRDAFLTQMAPELVQLPEDRAAEVAAQAGRLGTPRIVKVIETLGLAINDMRNAPDSRVVLEVALVRLVHRELQMGIESLLARVERLEKELENRPQIAPAPVNPSTGRAVLGGRVAQDPSAPAARPAVSAPSVSPAPVATPAPSPSASEPAPAPVVAASTSAMSITAVVENWNDGVIGELKGMRRAVAQMAKPVERDGQLILLVDNEPSAKRVNEYMPDLSAVIFKVAGGKCQIMVETRSEEPRAPKAKVVEEAPEEEFVDIEEIKQLPTVSNKATETNLADAFPGSELLTEDE